MRLEMVNEMANEILNGGEILVNCKFNSNQNLNLNLYHEIQRNSNPIKISIRICTARYRGIWVSRFWLVDKISPPFRIAICISLTISSLIFAGTGGISYNEVIFFVRAPDPTCSLYWLTPSPAIHRRYTRRQVVCWYPRTPTNLRTNLPTYSLSTHAIALDPPPLPYRQFVSPPPLP